MKFSQMLIKTRKETPADADSFNAALLIRGSFVEKHMAGVYALLPLGFRVYKKIENIVREEMNSVGGQEILMNVLQPKELWSETGRWEEGKDVMYRLEKNDSQELGLGWSHEEQVVDIVRKKAKSYKDLPLALYQIYSKFRKEARPKSGLLRGREFLMKDMYSFHVDEKDFEKFYDEVKKAYFKAYDRMGLEVRLVEAAGGLFADYSHEFQVFSSVGEDTVFYCEKCDFAQNKEISKVAEGDKCPKCGEPIKMAHGIEVGNIFPLKNKYSKPMKAVYLDEKGSEKEMVMGCYGIGMSRCIGAIVEISHDDYGIIWPKNVAPFKAVLIDLTNSEKGEEVYEKLSKEGEILFDDREVAAGVKFSDADLLGIPVRLVISEKTEGKIELKKRNEKETQIVDIDSVKSELLN